LPVRGGRKKGKGEKKAKRGENRPPGTETKAERFSGGRGPAPGDKGKKLMMERGKDSLLRREGKGNTSKKKKNFSLQKEKPNAGQEPIMKSRRRGRNFLVVGKKDLFRGKIG